MNKYYFDFFRKKLKEDIIHDLIEQGLDEKFVYREVDLYFEKNEIEFNEIDYDDLGRELGHPGIKSHKWMADYFLEKINE